MVIEPSFCDDQLKFIYSSKVGLLINRSSLQLLASAGIVRATIFEAVYKYTCR